MSDHDCSARRTGALPALRAAARLALATAAAFATALVTAQPARPDIVLIVADDLNVDDMRYLPRAQAWLQARGATFDNALVGNSLDAPSRVTLMTGRYAHNTGIHTNDPPLGGFDGVQASALEATMLPVWLRGGGYATAYVGRYLSGYGDGRRVPPTHVPAGWDHWVALAGALSYYRYPLNVDGTMATAGGADTDYLTDAMGERALGLLSRLQQGAAPYFLTFAPLAPHQTTERAADGSVQYAEPAPRHRALFEGLMAPRNAGFDEADVTDKPAHVRTLAPLSADEIAAIDLHHRTRAQSLASLDEVLAALFARIDAAAATRPTYVVFTSDNGFHLGDHRIRSGMGRLYDSAYRVPLLVSGPRVLAGMHRPELVLNHDLAPTIAEWAGLAPQPQLDGRSFNSLLHSRQRDLGDRKSALVTWVQRSRGLRLRSWAYHETPDRFGPFVELYDLLADPHQARNIAAQLTPESAAALSKALAEMAACKGAQCRALENRTGDALVVLRAAELPASRTGVAR